MATRSASLGRRQVNDDELDAPEYEAIVELSDDALADGLAELRWELRSLILAGAKRIVIDVSRVSHLSSSAVAAMLGAHRSCRARGGGVVIRDPSRRTLDLLHRTGLWRVLRLDFSTPSRARTGENR